MKRMTYCPAIPLLVENSKGPVVVALLDLKSRPEKHTLHLPASAKEAIIFGNHVNDAYVKH